ncbi:hypothetical protein [Clostridium lundense]|uniref:hypothetical protein n=1 Tax=Clostridium lundense TaxID=319475 RepID=UPI00068506F4|nr:hypothetical protein [Clostridium lundense]
MFIENNPKDNVNNVLETLRPSLKEVKQQSEWPGTIYLGEQPVFVYYYNTDNHAKEVLKQVSNSLHDWLQPNLPEDLSFIKNSKPWLINTSHENGSYILTDDDEEINRIRKINGLIIRL